jgi:poly-beta-hydroxyalkanoate depolymerase
VVVRAYKVQVALDVNPPRFKVFLVNQPPPYRTAAESILHEEQLPFAPSSTVLVGPPL